MAGLLAGVGLLSVLALFIPWRDPNRRRTLVVGLVGFQATIWALVGMGALYEHALNASRIAVWAAIIVLVAVAWDVVMSGESMTNHGTKRIPRAARVLAFLGYTILVSATVLFYSAQTVTGTGEAAESLFEPEAITRNGLFRIAFPLAVLMFLLRFGREGGSRRGRHSQGGQDEPVLEPVNGWASNQSDKDV
jgi:Mn2+/Fe2+ NRAMP family transporter